MAELVRVFENDDAGYMGWLASNPYGYVLSFNRALRAQQPGLHRAKCAAISGGPAISTTWTKDYIKICSLSKNAVLGWARTQTSQEPKPCALCNP